MVALGDDREDARDADAVRAHRDGGELAVLVEHLEAERLGVLATELEHVPDLDAAGELDRAGAVGRRVAGAHVGRLDDGVGDEVAARDESEDVLLVEVGARDPLGAVDDAGVDEEADARGGLLAEHRALGRPRADVALDETGVLREVGLGRRLDLGGRERHLDALHLDVAVAGEADDDELAGAVEVREREHDVLQRVGGRPRAAVGARVLGVREVDERRDRRRVRRVQHDGRGEAVERDRLGRRWSCTPRRSPRSRRPSARRCPRRRGSGAGTPRSSSRPSPRHPP